MTLAELDRNPTVKEEILAAGQRSVNAGMYTYPVHQAADILFCKADLVPVGKDQLPHLELTRTLARRFNARYGPVFPEPQPLLGAAPEVASLLERDPEHSGAVLGAGVRRAREVGTETLREVREAMHMDL